MALVGLIVAGSAWAAPMPEAPLVVRPIGFTVDQDWQTERVSSYVHRFPEGVRFLCSYWTYRAAARPTDLPGTATVWSSAKATLHGRRTTEKRSCTDVNRMGIHSIRASMFSFWRLAGKPMFPIHRRWWRLRTPVEGRRPNAGRRDLGAASARAAHGPWWPVHVTRRASPK